MKTFIALLAVGLMGAGPLAPFPEGAPVRTTSSVAAASGGGGGDISDGGYTGGDVTIAGHLTVTATGASVQIPQNGQLKLGNGYFYFDGFYLNAHNPILGASTLTGTMLIANGINPVAALAVSYVGGSAAATTTQYVVEAGTCTASSNACPSTTLHFSGGTPICTCSDTNSTLGACSATSITSGSVVFKTFGASDVATWICIGLQ